MQPEFWLECWRNNALGFQLDAVHPLLVSALPQIDVAVDKVFVPLCGKSPDLLYLAQRYQVVGAELSDIACRDFFTEHQLDAVQHQSGSFTCFSWRHICLWQGDFFCLQPGQFDDFGLVYDRAALIALPGEMRQQYAQHLCTLAASGAQIILISLEYPQAEKQGPPFSVGEQELQSLFPHADIQLLAEQDLTGKGFARRRFATSYLSEKAYLIKLPA